MGIRVDIPGWRTLELEHLVLDLNGTLALDGVPTGGVRTALADLAGRLDCHLITADTFGTARELFGNSARLEIITPGDEAGQKLEIIKKLGVDACAALGNGANDVQMLKAAALGICVIGGEGASSAAMAAANIVTMGPLAALGLLQNTDRLRATLRR